MVRETNPTDHTTSSIENAMDGLRRLGTWQVDRPLLAVEPDIEPICVNLVAILEYVATTDYSNAIFLSHSTP